MSIGPEGDRIINPNIIKEIKMNPCNAIAQSKLNEVALNEGHSKTLSGYMPKDPVQKQTKFEELKEGINRGLGAVHDAVTRLADGLKPVLLPSSPNKNEGEVKGGPVLSPFESFLTEQIQALDYIAERINEIHQRNTLL